MDPCTTRQILTTRSNMFRMFSTQSAPSKQALAKLQLKLLPNPLADLPARPANAYGLFVQEQYPKFKSNESLTPRSIMTEIAAAWKNVTDRSVYNH
jgi:hypothetical protein